MSSLQKNKPKAKKETKTTSTSLRAPDVKAVVETAKAITRGLDWCEAHRLAQARAQEQSRRLISCHIGPYAGGICTICGLKQPEA